MSKGTERCVYFVCVHPGSVEQVVAHNRHLANIFEFLDGWKDTSCEREFLKDISVLLRNIYYMSGLGLSARASELTDPCWASKSFPVVGTNTDSACEMCSGLLQLLWERRHRRGPSGFYR